MGAPSASGTGTASGRLGASFGSHRRSFSSLPAGPIRPGQPRDHVVAEPIERVVRSHGQDRFDRELGPLRKLLGEQPADESRVGVHLVRMHPGRPGQSAFQNTVVSQGRPSG